MKKVLFIMLLLMFSASKVFAYDATVNFKQQFPELISGWYVKGGPTKGGPYTNIQDCGKVVVKSDGTFDCKVTNYTANPAYAVVIPYDNAKKELAQSAEATVSVTVPAPTDVKIIVTITTVSTITKSGNVIAHTTIKRESVPLDKQVVEGIRSYRSKDGRYITNTVIVSG